MVLYLVIMPVANAVHAASTISTAVKMTVVTSLP